MSKRTTEPFHCVARLMDGRINSADGLIYLDGILYHAWFAKYAPEVLLGTQRGEDFAPHFGLPLRQLPGNRYACSVGFYTQAGIEIEHWNKRADFSTSDKLDYLDTGKAGIVNVKAGTYKAYRMPQVIRTVGDIEFYGVGTIAKIRELLEYIPALGKKPAAGWGMVREWTVEPFDEDWSTWSDKYGLMRPLPKDECEGRDMSEYTLRDVAIRPPSWKHVNWMPCYVPKVSA